MSRCDLIVLYMQCLVQNCKLVNMVGRADRPEFKGGSTRSETGVTPEELSVGTRFDTSLRVSTPSSPWLAQTPRRRGSARGPVWRFAGQISLAHLASLALHSPLCCTDHEIPHRACQRAPTASRTVISASHRCLQLTSTMLP
jgi:hypothetical protein